MFTLLHCFSVSTRSKLTASSKQSTNIVPNRLENYAVANSVELLRKANRIIWSLFRSHVHLVSRAVFFSFFSLSPSHFLVLAFKKKTLCWLESQLYRYLNRIVLSSQCNPDCLWLSSEAVCDSLDCIAKIGWFGATSPHYGDASNVCEVGEQVTWQVWLA